MNPLLAWNRFWFGPISARPLGAYRIVFGLIYLANLAILAPEADVWLSDAGILRGSEARELAGPFRLSPLQWVQDPLTIRLVLIAAAIVAVLFTLGWRTRMMSLLLYGLTLSIHHRNLLTASGADSFLMILTFLLMLSPCGAAYSLDARRIARQRGTVAEPLILPWSQRLIQIQLAVIYFATAYLKALGASWTDGTALYYVLSNGEARRFTLGLIEWPLAIRVLTYAALIVEFALPFLLWFRASRPWIILAGLGLHGSILLTVNIPIFGELMTSCYLLFLTAPELDALLRRLNPWRGSHPRAAIPVRVDRRSVQRAKRREGARSRKPAALGVARSSAG